MGNPSSSSVLASNPLPAPAQVQWLEQQVAKRRSKRDLFREPTDPKFPQQWYLVRDFPSHPVLSPDSLPCQSSGSHWQRLKRPWGREGDLAPFPFMVRLSPQSGVSQRDLNVKEAWAQGFTGRGIVVSILDDGIEKNHPDLAGNYVRRWGEIPVKGAG